MNLFDDFFSSGTGHDTWPATKVNPASGLPMIGDTGSVDAAGNPYGCKQDDRHRFGDNYDWLMGEFGFDPWDPW